LLAFVLALSAGSGCAAGGSAQKQCPSDTWSGMCVLSDLKKVEEREMPLPWVVYEAVYTPQNNAQWPQFAPPELRMRFGAPAASEGSLKEQLSAQAAVPCHAPMTEGACMPGAVVANVVPFDPTRAAAAQPAHITGCAAIDATSEQDRLNQSYQPSAGIPEHFTFAEGSSTPDPSAKDIASAIAKRLANEQSLECVGVVGQISAGESPSLAEARARAIKGLLESLGVDRGRLMTIAVTAKVFGPGSNPQPPDPGDRRVSMRVLLGTGAAAAPAPSPAPAVGPNK
jgi:outer membrane protein OmpA-like peptidoglycan-associated protein